jgi:hypothetical protein
LKLESRAGGLAGELIWKWGGVWRFEGPESVRLSDDGELTIRRREWKQPLTLRRIGDVLEGSLEESEGKVLHVIGTAGSENADVAGVWDVFATVDGEEKRGRLVITQPSSATLAVRAYGGGGEEIEVREARLAGEALRFVVAEGDGVAVTFEGEARGDRLEGRIDAGGVQHAVRGERRRAWGTPIQLLARDGLAGWRPRDRSRAFGWTCKDGVLTNDPGEGRLDVDIVSDLKFSDFKLALEYKVSEGGNSGVYLRGRYEVQILDDAKSGRVQPHGNGAVYSRILPTENASKPAGEWQRYEITLIGRRLTVVLNGKTIVDNQRLEGITGGALDPFESRPGPLMLQGDHGKVWFRNISITPAAPVW